MNIMQRQETNCDAGLITIKDAARFLCVSRGTVYNLMDNGYLPFIKLGRSRRIAKTSLSEIVTKNSMGGWKNEKEGA